MRGNYGSVPSPSCRSGRRYGRHCRTGTATGWPRAMALFTPSGTPLLRLRGQYQQVRRTDRRHIRSAWRQGLLAGGQRRRGPLFRSGHVVRFGRGVHLSAPSSAYPSAPSGKGYWLVARGRRGFSFGGATFYGSANGGSSSPAVSLMVTPDAGGYWVVRANGTVTGLGDAGSQGSPATGGQVVAGARVRLRSQRCWLLLNVIAGRAASSSEPDTARPARYSGLNGG